MTFLEVPRVWDIHSKVEDRFLCLAPPLTKEEAQCLPSLFGFRKQH